MKRILCSLPCLLLVATLPFGAFAQPPAKVTLVAEHEPPNVLERSAAR